jgi:hypothetical protein
MYINDPQLQAITSDNPSVLDERGKAKEQSATEFQGIKG